MEVKKGYKQTEVGIIPGDWSTPMLGDLFTFKNGLNKAKSFFGYGTPIVNYMDIYGRRGLFSHDLKGRVSLSKEEIKAFEVRKGDVFFTRTSETVEEVGITSVMLDEPHDTVFSGFVLRARPKDDTLDDQFKKYCFSPSNVRKQIVSQSTETTRALTNGRCLSVVAIALPPTKAEQSAIATALSDADVLINSLEKLINKKRRIKQGAMQQLLTGKKRLPGFGGEWKVKRLGEVVSIQGGYAFKSNLFTKIGVPVIRISDVIDDKVDTKNSVYYTFFEIPKQFIVTRNNILIAMSGATTGKIGIYNYDNYSYLNQRVGKFIIKNPSSTSQEFISHFVRSNSFTIGLQKEIAQGAQPNISGKQIESIEILLPLDVDEQTAIAKVLSDMDAEIEGLERKLAKYRLIQQGMMQELLTGKKRLI